MSTINTFRINNFDLIRLFAALEVTIHHTMSHLDIKINDSLFLQFLNFFPGVPIFFFISGFLISKSYENSHSIKNFAKNRIFRIFPGLFLVTIVGIFSVYLTGYFLEHNVSFSKIIIWFTAQVSIVQFYNPDFMRSFGVGVLNGSLWTICVELQFYIIIPILYSLFKTKTNVWIYGLIAISMLIHLLYYEYKEIYKDILIYKLLGVTFIPWIWMFLVGVLFQKNFEIIHKYLHGKIFYIFPIFIIMNLIGLNSGNGINPILFFILITFVFSLGYSYPMISFKILKNNDISYGVYIYHMIFINLFIYYGYTENVLYAVLIILLTLGAGLLSWFFLEKPILKLKKKTLHSLS